MYVADFEATTDPNDCRVWSWGLANFENDDVTVGKDLDEFFEFLYSLESSTTIYFHNLKFDGEFIFHFLFENGYKHVMSRKLVRKRFNTLITDNGIFYKFTVKLKTNVRVTFIDSLKILPFGVSAIAKAFGTPHLKGEIDYNLERPKGWEITDEEREYIENDVLIVRNGLRYMFNHDLNKMTLGSNALNFYKETVNFDKLFPKLDFDTDLRKAYRGGWTYCDPRRQGKIINGGVVYDVNSIYPYVMRRKKLPYGEPIRFEGAYEYDDLYDVYIINFTCEFEIKEDMLPTLQIKGSRFFGEREYLKSSNGELTTLVMTSVDFELFKKHYDIYNIEFIGGWKFKSSDTLFVDYIDYWVDVKIQADKDGNKGMRTLAKLMLNNLYGKFAVNPRSIMKYPTYKDGLIKYETFTDKPREPLYVAVACFITAYARELTISSAQNNYDRFLYADTDSIHLEGKEDGKGLWIDPYELGAWKLEYVFDKGKFVRAKSYIEEVDGVNEIRCAGLPHGLHPKITFDNFKDGLVVDGKLRHKRVHGGVILEETTFKLKL